jgi:hypothetical protein
VGQCLEEQVRAVEAMPERPLQATRIPVHWLPITT